MKTNTAHTVTTLHLDSPQASKISYELEIGLELVMGLRERASTFTFCLPERCLRVRFISWIVKAQCTSFPDGQGVLSKNKQVE